MLIVIEKQIKDERILIMHFWNKTFTTKQTNEKVKPEWQHRLIVFTKC